MCALDDVHSVEELIEFMFDVMAAAVRDSFFLSFNDMLILLECRTSSSSTASSKFAPP